MRLRGISAGDDLTQGILGTEMTETEQGRGLLKYAKLLAVAEFYNMGAGNADDPRQGSTTTGGGSRAIDAEWADNKADISYARVSLKIIGGKVRVDKAHERRGGDVPSIREREALSFAEDLGRTIQNLMINGDAATTATEFTGIKKPIDDAVSAVSPTPFQVRLKKQVIVPSATTGLVCELGNSDAAKKTQQRFIQLLDAAINKVGGMAVIVADERTISFIQAVGKEYVQYVGVDEFGQPLMFYRGRRVIESDFTADGTAIIPHNEAYGTGGGAITTGTRIYVIRFGEMTDVTMATNVGLEVKDEMLVGNFYTHGIELDTDLQILEARAVAVVKGFTVPTYEV